MNRKPTRINGHNSKCLTCSCQALGAIRPECLRGVIGYRDPATDEWRFDPLPCAFDARRVLRGLQHFKVPNPHGYTLGRTCSDCPNPISNNSGGRCRHCAARARRGVARSWAVPPNEAWRKSFRPAKRQRT